MNLIILGLYDKEIHIGKPDVNSRVEILRVLTKNMNLSKGACLTRISEETHGYTGKNNKQTNT